MQIGTKISLAAHGGLVTWVVFGAWFPSEPLPFKVQEVSVISSAEFARLSAQIAAPEITSEPTGLSQPEPTPAPELPGVASQSDPEPTISQPDPIAPPEPDPEVIAQPTPEPAPDPEPETVQPPQTPALPAVAALVPLRPEPPQARPADRVAPVPIAPPMPDMMPDDVVQPDIAPDPGAETDQEVQEASAPEAASDHIVTEADAPDQQASIAPTQSLRPKPRPSRPNPAEPTVSQNEAATPPSQPASEDRDAVAEALAEALAETPAETLAGGGEVIAPEPSGPPLTLGEKDALRVAVSNCWNVGSLSTEALRTTVVVAVSLNQQGKPDSGSVRLLSSSGGSDGAAKQAFAAARRAIIRCGAKGFKLPPEKYGQWRDIEMTFNPERMRIK